jgi:hypothetical protein
MYGIACPTTTICEGVSSNTSGTGAVVPVINGSPGGVVTVPGTAAFLGIACLDATACETVGSNLSVGAVVPIAVASNGIPTPGSPVGVPDSNTFASISCPLATACEVSGSPYHDGGKALIAPIAIASNGITPVPGAAKTESGTSYLQGIGSPAGTALYVLAGTNSSGQGVVVASRPVNVTCAAVGYDANVPGTIDLMNCTNDPVTGGSGSFTQSTNGDTTTETISWSNGETSIASETVTAKLGTADKCPAPPAGFENTREDKVAGTIIGGTDGELIGSSLKRTTCLSQGNESFMITLLPGTVAHY